MKYYLIFFASLYTVNLSGQAVDTLLKPKEISFKVKNLISSRLYSSVYEYRMKVNPLFSKEDYTYFENNEIKYRNPKTFLLKDTVDTYIGPLLKIEPWKLKNGVEPYFNFYVVYKQSDIFLSLKPGEDTLKLDFFSQYYPFDEKYLVYCDSLPPYRGPFILSGACYTDYFYVGVHSTQLFMNPLMAAELRLFRFNVDLILPIWNGPDLARNGYHWYSARSCDLFPGKHVLIKVPDESDELNHHAYSGIEVISFGYMECEKCPDEGWWEHKYTLYNRPEKYEDTLLKKRKLTQADWDFFKQNQAGFKPFFPPYLVKLKKEE